MSESRERNTPSDPDEKSGHSRDEEATSKDTLSDVEETEKVSTPRETGSPTETSSPGPSPDGPAGGGRADGSETGGPM